MSTTDVTDPASIPAAGAKPGPDLALSPPMGWNTWNAFRGEIDESKILGNAQALISSGMADAGYRYVVVDDCWQAPERDAAGRLHAAADRFPRGIAGLADQIHAMGLKFGIYAAPGEFTCGQTGGYPGRSGSGGHEYVDAQTFAEWGVDYVKYDWCCPKGTLPEQLDAFTVMRDALASVDRPMVYSINPHSLHLGMPGRLHDWGPIAHLWRITHDIALRWCTGQHRDYPMGVVDILEEMALVVDQSGPDHWADPDMLEIGNGTWTLGEERAHFALWAILGGPLMAGNDLRTMTPQTKTVLTNSTLISINQDWGGSVGRRVWHRDDSQVWVKPLSDSGCAVLLLNAGERPADITVGLEVLGLDPTLTWVSLEVYSDTRSPVEREVCATVAPHESLTYRLSR